MNQPTLFTQTIRKLARKIPAGHVTTYGILARAAGGGGQAARSVSSILAKDPNVSEIPFHRIVYSSGKVWASGQHDEKRNKLYKKESIEINEKGKIVNFRDILVTFGVDV